MAVVRIVTALVERAALRLANLQMCLHALLPALLPPDELMRLTRRYYDSSYRNIPARDLEHAYRWTLEPWEEGVIARHLHPRGRILVLGSGVGRESLALARCGFTVFGLDASFECLQVARRRAATTSTVAHFVQGDFSALPSHPGQFDAVLLCGVMYSAIPGRTRRLSYLKEFHRALRPGGKVVLNFLVSLDPSIGMQPRLGQAAMWLHRQFHANPEYQPGDSCTCGHFAHTFATLDEVRTELEHAGIELLDLNWQEGFAVLCRGTSTHQTIPVN